MASEPHTSDDIKIEETPLNTTDLFKMKIKRTKNQLGSGVATISHYIPEPAKKVMGNKTVQISTAVGMGTAVTIPIVIPALVGVLGFGPAGIIYGSVAAKLMSISGPVVAGGLIAICQSIGATGMISLSTIMGSGVTVAGVTGLTLSKSSNAKGKNTPEETRKESKMFKKAKL
eukprot:TRINITY_DN3505_c0_g1_i2.p1 TRINITY_DN3505_c0_g1~~TRINITY_DN3505_c0_g1_i2.p1  ORF type:complete len:173 (+),score=21.18 TRINITY_DN3505_c0_g1_i2:161-679(+)